MDALTDFLRDPLVVPIIGLLVVAAINFILAVYRSLQQGQFDWEKLPRLLDTLVVKKVFPLMLLGAAAFFVTEDAATAALTTTYLVAATAALAGEVAALIRKITNSYAATRYDGSERPPSPDGGPTDPAP
jgi:hypothetical protein